MVFQLYWRSTFALGARNRNILSFFQLYWRSTGSNHTHQTCRQSLFFQLYWRSTAVIEFYVWFFHLWCFQLYWRSTVFIPASGSNIYFLSTLLKINPFTHVWGEEEYPALSTLLKINTLWIAKLQRETGCSFNSIEDQHERDCRKAGYVYYHFQLYWRSTRLSKNLLC